MSDYEGLWDYLRGVVVGAVVTLTMLYLGGVGCR